MMNINRYFPKVTFPIVGTGRFVRVTDRTTGADYQVVAPAGIRRFPTGLARRVADFIDDEGRVPPGMRLAEPVKPACLVCGHPETHMPGCYRAGRNEE